MVVIPERPYVQESNSEFMLSLAGLKNVGIEVNTLWLVVDKERLLTHSRAKDLRVVTPRPMQCRKKFVSMPCDHDYTRLVVP